MTDTTNIEGISMKSFLSHVQTKHYLTEYLAKNQITQFIQTKKHFVIVYHNISISNFLDQHFVIVYHNISIPNIRDYNANLDNILDQHFVVVYHNISIPNILDQHFVVVVYHNISIPNIIDQHEQADTLIILHTLDVALKDSHSDLCIFSSDTDVLLYVNLLLSTALFKNSIQRKKEKRFTQDCYWTGLSSNNT